MSENSPIQSLREVCSFLDSAEIGYVLVGGLAVSIWAEPRATVDIDFLVSLDRKDFSLLVRRLHESGQFVFIHDKPMIFKRISFLRATLKNNTDVSVDFIFSDDDFKAEALKRRVSVSAFDFSVPIPTPEDLILLKRLSGRPQDIVDAQKILATRKAELDMDYIRKWEKKLGLT